MIKSTITKVFATLAAVGLILGGSVHQASAATSTIHFYLAGDVNVKDLWEKTLIPEFSKLYPDYDVEVIFDRNGVNDQQTMAKIVAAKVTRRDPGIDLIDGGIVPQLGGAGLLWRQSKGLLPNIVNVPVSLLKNGKGGIPYRASTVLLAYNSKNVTTPPKTLAELLVWAKEHPGKFT